MKKSINDPDWMMNIEPEIKELRNKYKLIYSMIPCLSCVVYGCLAFTITRSVDDSRCLIYNTISVCAVVLVSTLIRYIIHVVEDAHCSSRYKDICDEKMMRIYNELTTHWTDTIEVPRANYYTYTGVVGTMNLLYSIKDKLIGDVYSVSSTDAEYYWDGHDWKDVKELLHDPCKEQNKIDTNQT